MKYLLTEANQNTFVLFDCIDEKAKDSSFFEEVHRILLKEKRDDALILLGDKTSTNERHPLLQMLVLGQDGTFGEFCGNGALSCAAYLFDNYQDKVSFILKSSSNKFAMIKREKKQFVVSLPSASSTLNDKFIRQQIPGFEYIEIIEPHLAIQQDLEDSQLYSIGRALNEQRDLFPLGINVNAWKIVGENQIFVKTYERGVRNLTKSCGSGSACCATLLRKQVLVRVKTKGGDLEVEIKKEGILLKGQASYRRI